MIFGITRSALRAKSTGIVERASSRRKRRAARSTTVLVENLARNLAGQACASKKLVNRNRNES